MKNRPASLAYASDDIINLMICAIVSTTPFNHGIDLSLEIYMFAPY